MEITFFGKYQYRQKRVKTRPVFHLLFPLPLEVHVSASLVFRRWRVVQSRARDSSPDSAVIPSPPLPLPGGVLERVSSPGGVTGGRAAPRSSLSAGLARPQLRHRDDSETPITTAQLAFSGDVLFE